MSAVRRMQHLFLTFSLVVLALVTIFIVQSTLQNVQLTRSVDTDDATEIDNITRKVQLKHHLNTSHFTTCSHNIVISDEAIKEVFSRWRTTEPRDNILKVVSAGRMGNEMFEYASLLGIAFRTGKHPLFTMSSKSPLTRLFNISFIGNVKNTTWAYRREHLLSTYDCKLNQLPYGNVKIGTFLQSWKYFYYMKSQIIKTFAFTQKYSNLSAQCFAKYTGQHKNRPVIGLHVRRTDMIKFKFKGFEVAPLSYIRKAINYMKAKFPNPIFLIATDDKEWCRANLTSSDIILMENTDPYLDFATLTLCDHTIMTVGTFGWWAAFLTNGHTVYFKDYPRKGSRLAAAFTKEDFFMPDWVPLGA
ncbi:galactoside 2-alpha-L-fucosyltransferase SEC1-like [Haliotis cracherodii]|uniref:galactoside 2-alpha-L-fucosyltransferase SEC1-like n=1 Tax=Haliotis cracherodii TaxID=6455 RepID=UPI0039E9A022